MDLFPSSDEEDGPTPPEPAFVYRPPSLSSSRYVRATPSMSHSVYSSSSSDDDNDGKIGAPTTRPTLEQRKRSRPRSNSSSSNSSDDVLCSRTAHPPPSDGKISAIQHLLSLNANALSLPVFQNLLPPPTHVKSSSPPSPSRVPPKKKESSPPSRSSVVGSHTRHPPIVQQPPRASSAESSHRERRLSPLPRNTTVLSSSAAAAPTRHIPVYISPFGRQKTAADAMAPPPPRRHAPAVVAHDDWFSDIENDVEDDVAPKKRAKKKKHDAAAAKSPTRNPLPLLFSPAPKPAIRTRRSTSDGSPPPSSNWPDYRPTDEDMQVRWPQLPLPTSDDADDGVVDAPPLPLVLADASDDVHVQVHSRFNQFLLDYQRDGVRFLYDAVAGNRGAILGDDMGLGKTVQMLALLSAVLHKTGCAATDKPRRRGDTDASSTHKLVLIVVPASLLANWELECKVWMCCHVVVLHGKPRDRQDILTGLQERKGAYELVLCSYDMLKLHVHELRAVSWYIVVMDELHNLKNPDAQITKAVRRIPCRRKLGLSGTLMQNNADELHCVLDTVCPGCLGSLVEFRAFYIDDIKFARKKSAAPDAIARSESKERKLRHLLGPYYLHREKTVNPQFTKILKHDKVVLCELTKLQRAVYERVTSLPEYQALMDPDVKEADRGVLWHHVHPDGEKCGQCPLICLQFLAISQLLKIANHLDLIRVNPSDSKEQQAATKAFAEVALGSNIDEAGGVIQAGGLFEKMNSALCGKMVVLEGLLARWQRRREKALVFSRNVRMLDILQAFLIARGHAYVRLDGGTKVDDRLKLVQQFNQDASLGVFLISTKAGGLGLNITSATNVVVFDPSWNPAHDCQAQDRAYRIGQTKDVHVFRLITLGTIEEMIYARQLYKQHMTDTTLEGKDAPRYFEAIQGVKSQQGELFGLKNLLQYQPRGVMKNIQDTKAAAAQKDELYLVMFDTSVSLQPSQAANTSVADKEWQVVDELELSQAIVPTQVAPPKVEAKRSNLYIPQYLRKDAA
ncbi:Aste57867_589 [Aphanomyces stellatus]|uniref:Aste57867_589 protein n=1 Tax=Aphanomyces stellatus TaxID=120398 RepID=A0A485K404_9STRA|nr:hypothetical protein As57867_000588 [Aphanomyces stellatus]VFT77814.1 Aste57867_589 [Aphanomyces stellatus]